MSDGDDEPAETPGEEPAEADAAPADAGGEDAAETEAGEAEAAEEEPAIEGPAVEDALADAEAAIDADDVGEEELSEALDAVESALDVAETEADLDEVEATLDDVAAAIESADLPEPDEEDEEGPREELEGRVEDLRGRIEEERGPYAEDVVEGIEEAKSTLTEADWTEDGEEEATDAVDSFLGSVEEVLDVDLAVDAGDDVEAHAAALDDAATAVEDADLGADDDADTIATLLEAVETLQVGLEEAEEWSDLTTREQLEANGFYDVLGHRKDFPPEWSALKEHEKRGNADMILLALEKLGSEFMEEHCLDALRRMAPEEAVEPMLERADRRDKDAIEILGKIASPEAIETIAEYVQTDSDPQLQKVTLKALGEIGSEEATQAVADALVMENDGVRSHAARALGTIGDTRAVDPLSDVLADDDSDTVRASAAWALVQIGTEEALEAAGEHADDRSYLVSAEAEKAVDALGVKPA